LKNITEITKNAILDLFKNGIDVGWLDSDFQKYPYHGRLSQLVFLQRLYSLDKIQSLDFKHKNAYEEILQHTVYNFDYDTYWIFEDDRFPLKNGSDEDYLKFICMIFHPAVCDGSDLCYKYLKQINDLLRQDGYELYVCQKISGKNVYGWRPLSEKEISSSDFLPFSERLDNHFKIKTITKKEKNEIINIINKYDDNDYFIDEETGLNYPSTLKETAFQELKKCLNGKGFKTKKNRIEIENLDDFILHNSSEYVFDAIEQIYHIGTNSKFSDEINEELKKMSFQLVDGKIETSVAVIPIEVPIPDESLEGLIKQAESFYQKQDLQLAIEKLWDALERIKTLNGTDKTNFINKIFKDDDFKVYLENEFLKLTEIGNNLQIRHFETNKIPITNNHICMYLYERCHALLNLTLKFLNKK
jgi:hypothetical protein